MMVKSKSKYPCLFGGGIFVGRGDKLSPQFINWKVYAIKNTREAYAYMLKHSRNNHIVKLI